MEGEGAEKGKQGEGGGSGGKQSVWEDMFEEGGEEEKDIDVEKRSQCDAAVKKTPP